MAALIHTLDNNTPLQLGENGHLEYGWSNNIKEKILQFNFQITRTNTNGVNHLAIILNDLLVRIKYFLQNGTSQDKEVAKGHLSVLYRMIGHTRDVIDGKGEYALSYMMIYVWNKHFIELSKFALKCFFDLGDKTSHPYGSWKDIKYFCKYCKSNGENPDLSIIQYAISLVNEQISKDYTNFLENSNDISLVSKWTPREKSSFGWLYEPLATNYFSELLQTPKNDVQMKKAVLKCKTEYRKILSQLNRYIDTLQVKQCEQNWSKIDFNKVTSISLSKQRNALLNVKKNGNIRYAENNDRIICAENFKTHINRAVNGEVEMKGKRLGMNDFTKQAINLLGSTKEKTETLDYQIDLLNSQWRDNATQTGSLGKFIAMVDVSGSMFGEPINAAIALGIRISEKSLLGNRVMTFSATPTWINLDGYTNFISKVDVIKSSPWGMNTNFEAALDMILNAIVANNMPPQDVQDMVLVILSDMQMDAGDHCDKETLYKTMEKKYADAGVKVNGVPYKPPHILFWNLVSTNGFPSLENQKNVSMMSGFSPSILNLFCDQGMEALQGSTPWALLNTSLETERYKIMGNFLDTHVIV